MEEFKQDDNINQTWTQKTSSAPIIQLSEPESQHFSPEEIQSIQYQLTLMLSNVPETSLGAIEQLLQFTVNKIEFSKLLQPNHIEKVLSLLENPQLSFIPLQFLNLTLSIYKVYNSCRCDNFFECMKNIIETIYNDEVIDVSFQVLNQLIKKHIIYRDLAIKNGIYENLSMFLKKADYLPTFASFLYLTLQKGNYPPKFYTKFISTLSALYTCDDMDVKLCIMDAINSLAKHSAKANEIFSNEEIIQTLVHALETKDIQLSTKSMKLLRITASNPQTHEFIVFNNVFHIITSFLTNLEDLPPQNFIKKTAKFITQFLMEDIDNAHIVGVADVVRSINAQLFEYCQFDTKVKIIEMLRVYIQKCSKDLFIATVDPNVSISIIQNADSDDEASSYQIILYTIELVGRMPDIPEYEPVKAEILTDDFHDFVSDLLDSSNEDLNRRANILYSTIESIVSTE